MGELRAAVIGSGFGGLAAAIRLATAGVRVTVFEARDLPGGRAYVYRDQGFTFDAGPTVITAPHCIDELFAEAGRQRSDYVELLPVTPFYRLEWADGVRFDYDGDREHMTRQIAARRPEDVAGYEAFARYAEEVFDAGYTRLASTPFLRFSDMLRVAPQLAMLRADRSVYHTVAKYVRDEHVREALSFHSLLVGGNPYETSSIYTLIHHLERKWGVWFPRGGTGALVAALCKLLGDLGGELRLSAPVERIALDGRAHVVTSRSGAGGAELQERFDLVVSNADLHHTYSTLYAGVPAAAKRARKLERMTWSMSLYVLYFGTDRTYAEDAAHHTVVFGPRYRGLLDEIFHGSAVPEDFSLYLHAPHLTDPSLAPPGCGSFYVLSPVPHLGNAPASWDDEARAYGDRILASLERLLPDLRKHVVVRRELTPLGFQRELGAYLGNAFSVAPRLTQSAYFRPHNKDARIHGLYLVGAGTHPGAGVPGVINGAKATYACIARDFGLPVVAPAEQAAPTIAPATDGAAKGTAA
jgi:phytoene desaturase